MVYMGGFNKINLHLFYTLLFVFDQTLKSHAFLWISNNRDYYKDM